MTEQKSDDRLSKQKLEELRGWATHFIERGRRAQARLGEATGRFWYFAILGLQSECEAFDFAWARLQRVVEPPGQLELGWALQDNALSGAIGRYSNAITYELAVSRELDDNTAFSYASWIISALRIRTLAELLIPALCDYSWSTVSAVKDRKCTGRLLEDVPQAKCLDRPVGVTAQDLEWVARHVLSLAELLAEPRIRMAVDALCTHHHEPSLRMMTAILWSGIEAVFGIQAELRFRLSLQFSAVLEPRGEARKSLYRRMKKLYDTRSKAVHGAGISERQLEEHVKEVRNLLSRLLCLLIEKGRAPGEEEIEDLLLL